MNKKMKLITTLSILGISLGAGNTFANETVEYDPTQDPDSIEYQPDPGPLNQMGRPEYWEDTTSEEDNENAEENTSEDVEIDIDQPDPGPMGEMGKPIHDPDSPEYEPFQPDPGPMGDMGREDIDIVYDDKYTESTQTEIKEEVVVETTLDKENTSIDNNENPKTGDNSLLYSISGLISATIGLIKLRKR